MKFCFGPVVETGSRPTFGYEVVSTSGAIHTSDDISFFRATVRREAHIARVMARGVDVTILESEIDFASALAAIERSLSDRILTPRAEDRTEWDELQAGRAGGVRVEVWLITASDIDRVWGDSVSGPGWFWRRMDKVEMHGPFASREIAVDNFLLYRDVSVQTLEKKSNVSGNESGDYIPHFSV